MRKFLYVFLAIPLFVACGGNNDDYVATKVDSVAVDTFEWEAEQFADVRVLRYQIPGWEQLTLQQKQLCYYLNMAGLAGRDIMWDQNCRHNLVIRKALGMIIQHNLRGMDSPEWPKFMEYAKQVYFSNGIHHHYGMDKFIPDFSRDWFEKELAAAGGKRYIAAVSEVMFNPAIAAKKVSLDASRDLLGASAVNFYGEGVTDKDVERFAEAWLSRRARFAGRAA